MKADVLFYLSLFARRLPWFLLALFVCTGTGLGVAVTLPPVYEAGARLVVEAEKIPDELAASTVQTAAYQHLEIIEQRLMARGALLDMANRLDIYAGARPAADEIVRDLRSRITYTIEGESAARKAGDRATMLVLHFEDESPVMAAAVTNELVTRVMAEDVEMRTSVARQTLEFFDHEVSRLQQELNASSTQLMAFQQEHEEALPGSRELARQRIVGIEGDLAELSRETEALRRERERLVRLHETVKRREGRAVDSPTSYEQRQIVALRETLANLDADDPGADEIADRITRLSRRIAESGTASSTERTAFHRHRDDIDAKLAEAAERRAALLDQLEVHRVTLTDAPTKAAQLASLEEDHRNLRQLYNQAIEAKAVAETGDAIEALSKGQRIAIIEQASIPRSPARPNRKVVAIAGAAIGVVLGLAIVVILELRLGFLRRPVDLQRRLGIVPLATLPMLGDPEPAPAARPARRRLPRLRTGVAIGFAAAGIATMIAVMVGQFPYSEEIVTQWQRVAGL
ncbi:lipopolysaccharide biosynthesis protein [uncultured Jannaschia sp.]|uniref:GumC family protein n=1 Tax=uncultured Jannaschia sp. TaxID=293347 RepID=UPI0026279BAC|nr:lipopolysaccharide biosynthesis protein [uncultured Jannaschia sp.]